MTQYTTYQGGLYAIDDEVYITDRNNEARIPMGDALVDVQPDWDIDRAGSKGQVDIIAHRGVLKPNMWIAPYRTITPETGEVVRYQRGHFKLGRPGAVFDGTVDADGNPAHHQQASGSDIIDDLAAVRLTETFYTPVDGDPMEDVRHLIKLATVGQVGPNLVNDGGMEAGESWSQGFTEGGANGAATWVPAGTAPAEGKRSWAPQLHANNPKGAYVFGVQVVPLPANAAYLCATGVAFREIPQHDVMMELYFRHEAGGRVTTHWSNWEQQPIMRWARQMIVAPVPTGALDVVLRIYVRMNTAGYGYGSRSAWDDLKLFTVSHAPIPDSRINLPPSTARATTRIQTTVGKSIGYDAINADRLNAIGHHALYTTLDGTLTSSPLRDLGRATPKRTYGAGDLRLVDVVEVHPGGTDIPNHFPAIKEHFEDASMSLYAEAFNLNAKDPYSVTNTGTVISAPPIMSPDAVDEAALFALAEAARDRHSTMENLTFTVLDDSGLAVHDVIEITDPAMPEAMGKWAIEAITPDGPVMRIGARRAIGGGQ